MRTPVQKQHVHSFAAHCLRFCLFTAAYAARPSLQYICASISSLRGCTRVDRFGLRARMHSRRRVWLASDVCEAQLVKITGQTKNMKKTVLVQNEALEWGATCFPTRAFRLNAGTKHPQTVQNVEFVIISYLYWFRHLWYIIEVFPIRNVTQQGTLARNCPSKAIQVRLHPDIKT